MAGISLSVSSWNIMGTASASDRKKVTTSTFKDSGYLGKADIICIQEMSVKPSGTAAPHYLPFTKDYSVEYTREGGKDSGRGYNAVFYKKDKFKLKSSSRIIQRAFKLMDIKRKIYDKISRGGEGKIKDAARKRLNIADYRVDDSNIDDNRNMFEEVLQECSGASLKDFDNLIARYKAPRESCTKLPETLLKRRIAICHLKATYFEIVAISVHNYSGGSGGEAPKNFNFLLFDFVRKLKLPVVIAGDFNLDFSKNPSLCRGKFLHYKMKSPRKGLKRIDYIAVSNNDDIKITKTTAYTIKKPSKVKTAKVKITNHNPLRAELRVSD